MADTQHYHRPYRDRRGAGDPPQLCPECVGGGYVLADDPTALAFGQPMTPSIGELDICPRCDGTGIRQ